jgi:hypothetical protein
VNHQATVLSPDHAILRGPFSLALEFDETPTPDNFKRFEPTLGDTVKTFSIFRSKFSEPGLVTSDHGFEDAPDAERILGGINMKGPQYAAVARHGSFVMWGYQGYADDLTDTGRRLFLNTIAYAHSKRGAVVETLREVAPRDALAETLFVWRSFYETPAQLRASLERTYIGEAIPEEVITDVDAAHRWFDERRPYLRRSDGADYMAQYQLTLDRELQSLKIGNADPKLLDWIAEHLRSASDRDLAAKLLERYVPDVAAADFATWLRDHRDRLYFTETGGYVWRVRGTAAKSPVLSVSGAAQDDPVRVTAEVRNGALAITLAVRAPWHVYRPSDPEGRGLRLTMAEGSSFAVGGDLAIDADSEGDELHGYCELMVPLKRVASGDVVAFDLTYVACDPRSCKPPQTVRIAR